MSWREYIENLKAELTGKKVRYDGTVYTIATIDYNGIIHIDKPGRFTETTAVYEPWEARQNLV